ncbi:MAG: hypothetical protein SFZ03_10140 [Candidatus Melainabacteria bacterium]|nr:hypothetical protein [Candidatus Melainabacteria bacterium]
MKPPTHNPPAITPKDLIILVLSDFVAAGVLIGTCGFLGIEVLALEQSQWVWIGCFVGLFTFQGLYMALKFVPKS